jgi:hypothetical protein
MPIQVEVELLRKIEVLGGFDGTVICFSKLKATIAEWCSETLH